MTDAARTTRTITLAALAAAALTVATGVAAPSSARAASPEACVQQVMNGTVDWGGGTTWQRRNAVDLCDGARDHGARITCFTGMVAGGTKWRRAIESCKAIGGGYAAPATRMNAYAAGIVRFDGGSFERRGDGWVETGSEGRTRFTFDETGRDEWSVYLHDTGRDVRLQLDLHRELVLYEGSPLYPITWVGKAEPAAPRNRHTYTVAAGPIWNQADAEVKCPRLAARQGVEWTGEWWTTVQGKMSVCQFVR